MSRLLRLLRLLAPLVPQRRVLLVSPLLLVGPSRPLLAPMALELIRARTRLARAVAPVLVAA